MVVGSDPMLVASVVPAVPVPSVAPTVEVFEPLDDIVPESDPLGPADSELPLSEPAVVPTDAVPIVVTTDEVCVSPVVSTPLSPHAAMRSTREEREAMRE
jgi:hypothetical protein